MASVESVKLNGKESLLLAAGLLAGSATKWKAKSTGRFQHARNAVHGSYMFVSHLALAVHLIVTIVIITTVIIII